MTREDAISRQDVLQVIESSIYDLQYPSEEKALCNDIKALPPVRVAEKTGRWIPVSERLPEIGQRILATYNQEDEIKIDITNYTKYGFMVSVVIAWMPLPQPYNGESEESDGLHSRDNLRNC